MISPVNTTSATSANVPDDFTPRRRPSHNGSKPNHQRCNSDDADGVRCKPVLPGLKHWRRWPAHQPVGNCSPDPRHARPGDGGREEANNVAQPNEVETRTEVVLDQSSCNQGFCPVA